MGLQNMLTVQTSYKYATPADDGGDARASDEAVHEQADSVRAPRDLQLPADLLHRRQRQEAPRNHRRPKQLPVRRRSGKLIGVQSDSYG